MGLYLIETFPVGPLQCNCAIVADPTTREAVVIDPGDEPDRILEALAGAGLGALEVIHTPGHTPGSLCFRMPGENGDLLFSGDTLFRRSIGRTDLWGGSSPQILETIRDRLLTLPGGLRVIPGHGDETTIADEGKRNPFVGDPNYRPL